MLMTDVQGLHGQLQAVSMTLSAIIAALPPRVAAEAALTLQASLQVDQEHERDQSAAARLPAAEANRDALALAYVQLLQSRQRGEGPPPR